MGGRFQLEQRRPRRWACSLSSVRRLVGLEFSRHPAAHISRGRRCIAAALRHRCCLQRRRRRRRASSGPVPGKVLAARRSSPARRRTRHADSGAGAPPDMVKGNACDAVTCQFEGLAGNTSGWLVCRSGLNLPATTVFVCIF